MTTISAEAIVSHYSMLPHPEGGYYKETYRSLGTIPFDALPKRFTGDKHYSTAIYFLLEKGNFSAFHRIKSDECWHFYTGQTLLVHIIRLDGKFETIRLGTNLLKGETFQYIVPAGSWFASEPAEGSSFSFVGCTVAPGFDFTDFELADADELSKQYPQQVSLIKRLCRQSVTTF